MLGYRKVCGELPVLPDSYKQTGDCNVSENIENKVIMGTHRIGVSKVLDIMSLQVNFRF